MTATPYVQCSGDHWLASSRVRGWGNTHRCSKRAVAGEQFCVTCLKVERRNNCQCDKCGADVREKLQVGGRNLLLSKSAWAWCSCGKLTKFGSDNRREMVRLGLVDMFFTNPS